MSAVPLRVSSTVPGSKIANFQLETPYARLKLVASADRIIDGEAVLNEPLTFQGAPIKIAYSYTFLNGTAMSEVDYASMYSFLPEKMGKERGAYFCRHNPADQNPEDGGAFPEELYNRTQIVR